MYRKILLTTIILLISISSVIVFSELPSEWWLSNLVEYKNVTVGSTFVFYLNASSSTKWEVSSDDYDSTFFQKMGGGGGCYQGYCSYSFQFKALKEGESIIRIREINIADNSSVETKQVYMTVNAAYIGPTITCTDSDEGKNYYIKGTTTLCNFTNQSGGCGAVIDTCTGNTLRENYCDGVQIKSENYICPYGCGDGACLKETTNTTCTDSDGGKNYYVKGTITSETSQLTESCYLFNPDGSGSPVNECSSSDSRCKIHEHWCEGSTIKAEEYKCLYGCSNGACVKSTNNAYTVTIQASDPSDSYIRDWNIFTYDPTGTYIGNGKWSSGTPLKTSYYTRSGTWSVNLNSGTYYLVIGQTGGESYGTYSGEISINGVSMHFTNADINHAIKFNVPLQGNTSNKCVNHDECSQACDNLGIDVKWMGIGNSYKAWTGKCPSDAYGCMTGKCCLGQCKQAEHLQEGVCYCQRTNMVDIYGSVCPSGTVCGSDCYCHETAEEYKKAYLNKPFDLKVVEKAEIIDYKNMIVSLDKLETIDGCSAMTTAVNTDTGEVIAASGGGSGGAGCLKSYVATVSEKMPEGMIAIAMQLMLGQIGNGLDNTKIKFDSVPFEGTARLIVYKEEKIFKFGVKTDKMWYSPRENVRIDAILIGDPFLNFKDAKVTTYVVDDQGKEYPVEMKEVGIAASACTESLTTGAYTCPRINEYHFIGIFNVPSTSKTILYTVKSTAVVENMKKDAQAVFKVGETISKTVEVSLKPKEKYATIGDKVTYEVTITDKHASPVCIAETTKVTGAVLASEEAKTAIVPSPCGPQIYNYIIDADGLPYHTVFPNVVSVHSGGSKTFELKIFTSSIKTAEGIETAVQTSKSTAQEERTISISGKPIATQTVTTETIPVNEATFKFTVKASLREEPDVGDSDTGILHVKFVNNPEPPPFPEAEKIDIELRKGWNFVSVPGKGTGFTRGSCIGEKPIALVYLQDEKRYLNLEEALNTWGKEKLLEYISTHSFWIYSREDCKIGFNIESFSTYSGLEILKGWNLLGTTKDMIGETLNNIKGNCNFEKIYTWDNDSKKWVEKSESDLVEKMGYGILVKASSNCNLKENSIQPPPFPQG